MKKWIVLLALLISAPALSLLKGQAALSIVSFTATPDSLIIDEAAGDTLIHYEIKIANVSDDAMLGGYFWIHALYVDKGYEALWSYRNCFADPIPAHDTITIEYDDIVHAVSAKYDGGGDVIVIWPSPDGALVLDSGTTTVYIDGIISVTPSVPVEGRVVPFPNPATGVLNLQWGDDQNLLESVSITDIAGHEWRRFGEIVPSIDLSTIPAGVYFLKVQYRDGIASTYKLHITR